MDILITRHGVKVSADKKPINVYRVTRVANNKYSSMYVEYAKKLRESGGKRLEKDGVSTMRRGAMLKRNIKQLLQYHRHGRYTVSDVFYCSTQTI